jgi:hypothetical protein
MTKKIVTDEQLGRLLRKTYDLTRRIREGDLDFSEVVDGLQDIVEKKARVYKVNSMHWSILNIITAEDEKIVEFVSWGGSNKSRVRKVLETSIAIGSNATTLVFHLNCLCCVSRWLDKLKIAITSHNSVYGGEYKVRRLIIIYEEQGDVKIWNGWKEHLYSFLKEKRIVYHMKPIIF